MDGMRHLVLDPSIDGGTYVDEQHCCPRQLKPFGGCFLWWRNLFFLAWQLKAYPCEGPDLANEGVYLEYSTDGGATWITIDYFDLWEISHPESVLL